MSTIDIRTINILLDTNIPGKEVIPFTKSILYHPEENDTKLLTTIELNELPFFTMDIIYPENYLASLPYAKQVDFFFNKQNMSDIIQINSNTNIKSNIKSDSLTTKEDEKKQDEEKVKKYVKEQKKEIIETKYLKKLKIKKEDEERKEQEDALIDISNKLFSDIHILESKTIEQIDGKNKVIYRNGYKVGDIIYQTIDDYIKLKYNENSEIITNVKKTIDEIIRFDKIKQIFKPNEEYLGGISWFFGQGNKENVDEFNLYKDVFCKKSAKDKGNDIRLFDINESSLKWDIYKEQLITIFKTIQSNILFEIPSIDNIIKIISNIGNIKIDYDKYNIKEGEYTEKWKIIDEQLCYILPEIRNMVENIKELNKILDDYPLNADKKIDYFITEYNRKKSELEQLSKNEEDKIKELFFDKNNGTEIFGGDNDDNGEYNSDKVNLEMNEIADKNIMIMIRLLFPTKYPIIGNVFSSYHSIITGKNEFNLKWSDFIPGFLKRNFFEGISEYSYIKLDGKIFTIIQAIWLNDIYNHKEYKKLIEQFAQLQKWKKNEARKTEFDVSKKRKQIIQTFTMNSEYQLNELDIKNIQDILKIDISSRGAEYTLAKYKIAVLDLINIMKNLNIAKISKNEDNIIEYSKNFSDLFLELQEERIFNPKDKMRYKKIAIKIREDVGNYEAYKHILTVYLQSPGINMDYQSDKYRKLLEHKYSLYVRFIENIQNYSTPILESSNYFLQSSIDDFLNQTEKYKGIFNFLINPLNIHKNPYEEILTKNIVSDISEIEDIKNEQKQYLNRFNTGVSIRPSAKGDQSYYEIYIQMNLIGGELNDSNKSEIDCMYQGESLGNKLYRILNETIYQPWNINSSIVFFDITQGVSKHLLDTQENNNNKIKQTTQIIKGGSKSIRNCREIYCNNRRITRKSHSF